MLAFVRDGGTVLVHSTDCLARNLDDLRATVRGLTTRGVRVQFVKEQLTFTGDDTAMATLLLTAWLQVDLCAGLERLAEARARNASATLVFQEIWGHLCCHYAIRSLMTDAATHSGHDPDRVSFVAALRITRQTLAHQGAFSP